MEALEHLVNQFFPEPELVNRNRIQQEIQESALTFLQYSINKVYEIEEVSETELNLAIFSSSKNKAPGPDGIQLWILQECYLILKPFLLRIYNTCLNKQYFPAAWKKGKCANHSETQQRKL